MVSVDPNSWIKTDSGFLGNECSMFAPDGDLQKSVNESIIKIAKALESPLLLTCDSHFVKPESKIIQDVLLQNGNPDGWRFHSVYSHDTTESAWQKWRDQNGTSNETTASFIEGVENNQALVDMVEPIKFEKKYRLPEIEIPENMELPEDQKLAWDDRLENYTYRLIMKYGRMPAGNNEYVERLAREMEVICRNGKMNFLPYFLFLAVDVCEFADSHGIVRGGGRGSAAGCLLSYLLRITHIDPIKFDLSFERFLSRGRINRGKFPDIDLDFGDLKPVVDQLKMKYGDRFVRICTTGTMKVKDALRNVGRILMDTRHNSEMSTLIDTVAKSVENIPQGVDVKKWLYTGYESAEGFVPPHFDRNPALKNFLEAREEFKFVFDGVLNIPKSIGRHASAYCLADEPVMNILPMCKIGDQEDSEECTQFTMGPVEELGLVKFDLLGINTLKDIGGCLALIAQRHNIVIDIYDEKSLPIDDQEVYKEFWAGNNQTVFQFSGQIPVDLCKKVRPTSIEDLSQITAVGRPGTMYSKTEQGDTLIQAWISRKRQESLPAYVHSDVEPILRNTLGIVVYQEQIQKMFSVCCGYSEEQADEIREIVGKKKADKMEKLLPEIEESLEAKGWGAAQIQSFISLCMASASYSFNKCLSPDTVVQFKDGCIDKISAVREGDYIRAKNNKTGHFYYDKVVKVYKSRTNKELYRYLFDSGHTLICTRDHKVQSYPSGAMIKIKDMVGRGAVAIDSPNRSSKIITEELFGLSPVIDLEMESEYHNFVANGVVVSNSHSCSYAYIGYVCQWLKHHYPLEWWCSVLQNANNSDIAEFTPSCHQHITSPDINYSDINFYIISGKKIVFPLSMVFGVSSASDEICRARLNGHFTSIEDFYDRVNRKLVNHRVVKSLIWAGAFDSVHNVGVNTPTDRNEIYRRYLEKRGDGESFVPKNMVEIQEERTKVLSLGAANFVPIARENFLNRRLGFTAFGKLESVKFIKPEDIIGAEHVAMLEPNKNVRYGVCGVVEKVRKLMTKAKNNTPSRLMAFVTIKNGNGSQDITLFPDQMAEYERFLQKGAAVFAVGKVGEYNGAKTFEVNYLSNISE